MSTNHGEGAGGERPTPQETLSVSHFASLYSPPVAGTLAWPDAFSEFHEVEEGGKAGVPLWSPALFEGARALSNVRSLGALVLDYDAKGGALDPASILSVWREYECVLHSTYTPGSWRGSVRLCGQDLAATGALLVTIRARAPTAACSRFASKAGT